MNSKKQRDSITIEDENGTQKDFAVEALFDMDDQTYALLRAEDDRDDAFVMEVKEDDEGQYLQGINDQDKMNMLLDAYEVAVKETPAD